MRHVDGETRFYKAVRITGTVDFIPAPPDLADGPRYVALLVEGTMVAGK